MQTEFVVAGVQMDVRLGDKHANLNRIQHWLETPSVTTAQLLVFPECTLTGYCFPSKDDALQAAEEISGSCVRQLVEMARDKRKLLAIGMLERDQHQLFNTCLLIGPEGKLVRYRKTHLPFLGVDRFVCAGDQAPLVVDLRELASVDLRLGMHICYDASFPEATRSLMLQGADLVILPTNWPADALVFAEHLAPVRAMENHLFFMVVNRVGNEGGFDFIGHSCLCAPNGSVIASCPSSQEALLVAGINPQQARNKRIIREPGEHEIDRIRDRRPELYSKLVEVEACGKPA